MISEMFANMLKNKLESFTHKSIQTLILVVV